MAESISEDLCRICLKESYFYSNVFNEELDDGSHFVDVVNDLLQLDVEFEDGYPQSICSECYNKISEFDVFKRTAHEGRAVLLYSKGNIGNNQIKVEDEIANAGPFVPVQNEIYLVPVKTEVCDPIFGDGDPLKPDMNSEDETDDFGNFTPVQAEVVVKNEVEDHWHLDEDEGHKLDSGVSSMPVHFAESEGNGIQNTLSCGEDVKECPYEEIMIQNMGTTEEKDIHWEGRNELMSVSLQNANAEGSSLNDNVAQDECIFGDSVEMEREDENERIVITKKKQYNCEFCPKHYNSRYYLKVHERVHTGEKPYKCKFCGKEFTNSSDVKIHKLEHAGEKLHKCKLCPQQYNNSSHLKVHMRVHTGEKPYQCKFCAKQFANSSDVKIHERVHTGEKPYKCKFCPKQCNRSGDLKVHERVHTGEKPYKCKFCEKQFISSSDVKVHERVHTGEKPYKCKFCEKQYYTSSCLKVHERVHTGEKPYKCKFCGNQYNTSSDVKVHERVHTGEKPFKCKLCEKQFNTSSQLKVHERLHNE